MDATNGRQTDINTLPSNGFGPPARGTPVSARGDTDPALANWLEGCAQRCLALARARKWDDCAALARRWLDSDPRSADAALYFLNALKAPGTARAYEAALAEYQLLEQRLERARSESPAPEVARLASSIRDELARATGAAVVMTDTAGSEAAIAPIEMPSRRPPNSRLAAIPLAVSLFLAATSFTSHGAAPLPRERDAARPSVAVVEIRNLSGDSATAWLELGFPQMVTSAITRQPGIEAISHERVRDTRQGLDLSARAALGRAELVRLGARSGAAWVVSGSVRRGDSLYALDVTVQDSSGEAAPRLFTVTSSSLIALADQAAAKLGGLAVGSTPDFADVETRNSESYQHYVRARRASDAGRVADAVRELDAAIALDSSFASALAGRMGAASAHGETAVRRRLELRLETALEHAAPFDHMRDQADRAMHNGEHRRAEVLARALVERYPRDRRAYALLADVYTSHGQWDAADSVLGRALALDSAATGTGAGSCAPCPAYSGLAGLRAMRGDVTGAVGAAQGWVNLQSDAPGAWSALMATLAYGGRYDEALEAERWASAMAPNASYLPTVARILMMARRYDAADSVIARGLRESVRTEAHDGVVDALDARALLERERGQMRRSARTIDSAIMVDPEAAVLRLVAASSLARVGDYARARAMYATPRAAGAARPAVADEARAFAWHHALLADAIAPVADTAELNAIADSIELIGARSYYARDWRVAHHVRGLVAMRAGDYARAERELSAARWGVAGWTVTVVELARARMALGRPMDAVRTLRDAYVGPLDAMGRYAPRSDIDYWMSRAFAQAGMTDSARTYAGYVRRAWRTADPEVKRKLAALID